jgi:hypothetical protein
VAHEAVQHAKPVHKSSKAAPVLPPQVVSPADVGRLINELNQIDEMLLQLELRTAGDEVKMPKTSRLMDQIVDHNKLNLLNKADRQALKSLLTAVQQQAPRLHFSFGSDPPPAFTEKLIVWLRQEIHPYVLMTVGLQPGIGAGCRLRSLNKYFDFSLGQTLVQKRELLMKRLVPVPTREAAK